MLDVLADVLEATRTDGVVFARVEFGAPWGLRCDPAPVAGFHVVASGSCMLVFEDDTTHTLRTGDVVLVPHGSGHLLTDDRASPATPLSHLVAQSRPGEVGTFRLGGDGPETVLVCGGYLFDRRSGPHPLLELLPRVVHVPSERMRGATRAMLRELASEVQGSAPGASTIVNRLVDVLLVHLVRAWLEDQDPVDLGWLGGFRDPELGGVLQRMHGDLAAPLTVEQLARDAAMSPSTLKRRFRDVVGEPPASYLTRIRMDQAARLLRDTDEAVGRIARAVGYASEPAFSRAFARSRGAPPGRWRDELRANPPVSPFALVPPADGG